VLSAASVAVLVGVPLFLAFGRIAGADGAAAALVVGQLAMCAWEWVASRRLPARRNDSRHLARHN